VCAKCGRCGNGNATVLVGEMPCVARTARAEQQTRAEELERPEPAGRQAHTTFTPGGKHEGLLPAARL